MVACTTGGSASSSSRIATGSLSPAANPADSKAADLRVRLNLLLGEHVMVVAKQAVAASNHTDDYAGYLALLSANGNSLLDAMRAAFGNTAATQLDQAWGIQNGYLIDYTIGLVTHNDNKSNGAMSGLVNGFVPRFAQLITSLTQLPLDSMMQLETAQLTNTKTVIDDEVAQAYNKLYADLRVAYASSSRMGDTLAIRVAQVFPDKFPGDPSSKAVDARVSLNSLLQEHAYVTTMMSDAGIAGRGTEAASALSGVAGVRADLGPIMSYRLDTGARTPVRPALGHSRRRVVWLRELERCQRPTEAHRQLCLAVLGLDGGSCIGCPRSACRHSQGHGRPTRPIFPTSSG